jgi:hypothetical protein
MDREWLERELAAGRSIESLAREVGRPPSTVAYWVNKYGLASAHRERHAPRGGLPREALTGCVEGGLSIRQIASELGSSPGTVRHWLRRYGMKTLPARYASGETDKPPAILRECRRHGWTQFVRVGGCGHYRCARCNAAAVAARRRRVKEILVAEAGGCCRLCGFDAYIRALQFHHLDQAAKRFAISRDGVTRSLAQAREEARKCVLLCANCHAMVEAGLREIEQAVDYRG